MPDCWIAVCRARPEDAGPAGRACRKIAELEEALEGAEFFTAGHAARLATFFPKEQCSLTATVTATTAATNGQRQP